MPKNNQNSPAKDVKKEEQELEKKGEALSLKESAGIKESEKLLQDLKILFFKEAEIIANKNMSWEKKCEEGIKAIDEQNAMLGKIKEDTNLLFNLVDKSEKTFDEEEMDAFILSRTDSGDGAWLGDAQKIDEARRLESLVEKLNFLVIYDIEMLLQDQGVRKKLYEKYSNEVSSESSKKDFLKNQYTRLLKACRYLNEILKYAIGQEKLEKYEIYLQGDLGKKIE